MDSFGMDCLVSERVKVEWGIIVTPTSNALETHWIKPNLCDDYERKGIGYLWSGIVIISNHE